MSGLVLASGSSTRAALLRAAAVPFETLPARIDEEATKASLLAERVRPRAVAVVGASPDPTSMGGGVVANLDRFGYRGQIHLVNRNRTEIDGRPCVASVDQLPEGIDVVAWARHHERPTALLMLTARDAPADRIRGLDTGADDYLVKPFDFGELLARVRALQRRPRGVEGPVLRCGKLELDPTTRSRSVGGRPLKLTATELLILELLLRRSPAVVDRKSIAEHAWDDETDPLGSNAIDVQVSRLRAKLPSAGVRIVTVRGAGYRLDEA